MPIAYGKDTLYLAWQGTDEHLYLASSADGNTFGNKHALGETSLKSTRPSITFAKGLVFLAWIDHEDHINILSSPDGIYWSNKHTIAEKSHRKAPPALAYLGDRLYISWTGRDHKNHISITSFSVSDEGELAEFSKVTLDEESSEDAGPALTSDGKKLYLVWQGTDEHINIVESANGKDFQNKKMLKEKSPRTATPGITYGDGFFYLSWIGHDDKINLLSSADGENWSNKKTFDDKSSSTGVSGVTYGNSTLFVDWSGADRKHHLNVLTIKLETIDGSIPEGKKTTLEDEAEK